MLPVFESGDYLTMFDLFIYDKPGLGVTNLHNKIKHGTKVFIKRTMVLKYSVWGRIENGWICINMNQVSYVVPMKR